MQRTFRRSVDSLGGVFNFIDECAAGQGFPAPVLFAVKFAVEELFTNMVKYSVSDTQSDIAIDSSR